MSDCSLSVTLYFAAVPLAGENINSVYTHMQVHMCFPHDDAFSRKGQ
jgi:hypothetical protein